jgi:succinyl-diaminopimelate desuccinylase
VVREEVALTQALVQIPSENPTGTEGEIGGFIAHWLAGIPNVEVTKYEVQLGRYNVVAKLKGKMARAGLAFIVHMDTVPVGTGWTRDPYGGEIDGGLLYGRGAVDMKSGVAAAMVAFKRLADLATQPEKDILLCATIDEEGTDMLGALDLVKRGIVDNETVLVATEPNGLTLTVEHKGVVWYEIEIFGQSAHAGNPHLGSDAVLAMGRVITALKEEIEAVPYTSDYLGKSTITFGRVEGGTKTNVVPNYARCEIDVRIVKPMTIPELTELVEKTVEHATKDFGISYRVRQINIDRPPVQSHTDTPFVRAIQTSFKERTGKEIEICGFRAYTDASIISARIGNPYSYLFGPGSLEGAHTIDEHVPTEDIEIATDVLTAAVQRLLFTKA